MVPVPNSMNEEAVAGAEVWDGGALLMGRYRGIWAVSRTLIGYVFVESVLGGGFPDVYTMKKKKNRGKFPVLRDLRKQIRSQE